MGVLLAELDAIIREEHPWVHAVVVMHRGALLWERYYGGSERDLVLGRWGRLRMSRGYRTGDDATQVHCLKSCTKSVTSVLLGIAHARGEIDEPDWPVAEWLPEPFASRREPRLRVLTVRHLLEMRSGLDWVENGPVTTEWARARNKVDFALDLPFVADPGERWNYSTADSHLLGAVLERVTGERLLDYAARHLFRPLGIGAAARWTRDRKGICFGGSELYLSPRDMAAVGCLALQEGRWQGRELVPGHWIKQTTTAQPGLDGAEIEAAMPNHSGLVLPNRARAHRTGYGAHWWRGTFGGYDIAYAAGHGGQAVHFFPSLDLVIAQTASTAISPQHFTVERALSPSEIVEAIVSAVVDAR